MLPTERIHKIDLASRQMIAALQNMVTDRDHEVVALAAAGQPTHHAQGAEHIDWPTILNYHTGQALDHGAHLPGYGRTAATR
jgi:hypothetical protein